MSRIGICVPAVPGHLNPATTLGRELARRGHEVKVFCLAECRERIEAAGLEFEEIGAKEFPPGSHQEALIKLGKLRGMAALQFTVKLLVLGAEGMMRDLPPLLRDQRCDLLLADQVSPGAFTAGEHVGLPTAVVCNALAMHFDPTLPNFSTTSPYNPSLLARTRNRAVNAIVAFLLREFFTNVNAQRRQWSLVPMPRKGSILSQFPYLSQQPEWFDFPRRMPSNFHYTAPWHRVSDRPDTSFPWDRLDGKPLVYASMGTLQNRVEETFRCFAEACDGLGVQLVISMGNKNRSDIPKLPGNPVVVPFAPQLPLLKRAALVITHAGLNTALETLAAGVPMVAIPITNDQPGVAARLRHIGVAEVIPFSKLSQPVLRYAVQKGLRNDLAKQKAREYAQRLERVNGPALAADIVENVLSENSKTKTALSLN
jgi:zeaxanthin glucosyltransferase